MEQKNEKVHCDDVLSSMSEAIIIAEPVFSENEKDREIVDFRILFQNKSCFNITKLELTENSDFSSSLMVLSTVVDWVEVAKTVYETSESSEQSFYSSILGLWLKVVLVKTGEGLILLTISDTSRVMEHEQLLRRQNLRLAALSEELVISKQSLKNELEKTENLNTQLQYLAYHDKLTGLPNRVKMLSDLEKEINQNQKDGKLIGLMLIDVDDLKRVNDSDGHSAGDELLKRTGNILSNASFENFSVYRFGGDEFLFVCTNLDTKNDMSSVGDSILHILNMADIHVSAGISVYPEDSEDMEELFKFADMAMYDVKRHGKNSFAFFHHIMQKRFLEKINLESKLTDAMDTSCLQLYFQPQVDIVTKTLRGFEALLRWNDPDLGWISPEQFIPLAEESKLIIPLGDWVLDTALSYLAKWQSDFDFKGIMSVNVSPVQLKNPNFLFDLMSAIKRYKLEPSSVEIEITEGIFIDNMEYTVELLKKIKDAGIGISLDDFGTGYASLSYLQILPLTTLKIDKSFIANITSKTGREAAIANAIVSLVTKMGLDTIAEGVENEEQLKVLESINCRNTQGFLMGKPMPADRCERMLKGDESAILRTSSDFLCYKI